MVIWHSHDATAWTADYMSPPAALVVNGAARQGDRLVIVGEERTYAGTRGAVWVRSGSQAPERVRSGPVFEAGGRVIIAKAAGDDGGGTGASGGGGGFLAAGNDGRAAAVWQSADGTGWTRIPSLEALINKGDPRSVDALLTGPGGPLVLGRSGGKIASWYLESGQWKEATFTGDPEHDFPHTVVRTPTGFLAAGYHQSGDEALPSTWTSTDGRSWVSTASVFDLPRKPLSDTFGVSVQAVARVGTGWLAAGGGPSAKRVWTSADTTHWNDLPLPEGIQHASDFSLDLIATSGGDALIGSAAMNTPRLLLQRQNHWTEVTATDPGIPAPQASFYSPGLFLTPTGVGAWANVFLDGRRIEDETGTVAWWRSDGNAWQNVPNAGPFVAQNVVAVTGTGSGFVAVGGTMFSVAGLRQGLTFHAWSSSDGQLWDRRDPQSGDVGNQALVGVAARGTRQVAVGSIPEQAGADAVFLMRDGDGPWRKIGDVPGATGQGLQFGDEVCANDTGFVAVGQGSQGGAWFSPDGQRWQASSPGVDHLTACATTTGGFLAVGVASSDVALFASANGVDWTRVSSKTFEGPEDFVVRGMATEGDDVLLFGRATDELGKSRVALWRSGDAGRSWWRLRLVPSTFEGLYQDYVTGAAIRKGVAYLAGAVDDEPVIWSSPLAEAG